MDPVPPFVPTSGDSQTVPQVVDIIMDDVQFDDMPALQDVSDSSDSENEDDYDESDSQSESDRDAHEVEMLTGGDYDGDTVVIAPQPVLPPWMAASPSLSRTPPPSATPQVSANNRRPRVDDDEDEDRDRRHPSQRVGSASSSTPSISFPTTASLPRNHPQSAASTSTPTPAHVPRPQPSIQQSFLHAMFGGPSRVGAGTNTNAQNNANNAPFRFFHHMMPNDHANNNNATGGPQIPQAPPPPPHGVPQQPNANANIHHGPIIDGIALSFDFGPGLIFPPGPQPPAASAAPTGNPPLPGNAQQFRWQATPPGDPTGLANANAAPGSGPHPNPNRPAFGPEEGMRGINVSINNFATLLGNMGVIGVQGTIPIGGIASLFAGEEKEDPERARKLVDGLEEVPVGLVRRMERVGGGGDGVEGVGGGDGMCAICWDRLLDENVGADEIKAGKEEEIETKTEGPKSMKATVEDEVEDSDEPPVASSLPAEKTLTQQKIVSLPCAHVFHAECLIPWFSRPKHTTCPTCRFNIDPENLTYVSARQRAREEREATATIARENGDNVGVPGATEAPPPPAAANGSRTLMEMLMSDLPPLETPDEQTLNEQPQQPAATLQGAAQPGLLLPPVPIRFMVTNMHLNPLLRSGAGEAPPPPLQAQANANVPPVRAALDPETFAAEFFGRMMGTTVVAGGMNDLTAAQGANGTPWRVFVDPTTTIRRTQGAPNPAGATAANVDQPQTNPDAAGASNPAPTPNQHTQAHAPRPPLPQLPQLPPGIQGDFVSVTVDMLWNGPDPGPMPPLVPAGGPQPGVRATRRRRENRPPRPRQEPTQDNPFPNMLDTEEILRLMEEEEDDDEQMAMELEEITQFQNMLNTIMGRGEGAAPQGQQDGANPPPPSEAQPAPPQAPPEAQAPLPPPLNRMAGGLQGFTLATGTGRSVSEAFSQLFAGLRPQQAGPAGGQVPTAPQEPSQGTAATGEATQAQPPVSSTQQQQQQQQRRPRPTGTRAMQPNFFEALFGPGRAAPQPQGPKRPWAPPPAPGLTLRQRVERREREAGLRCYDVSCGVGPSDEDPVSEVLGEAMKQLAIRHKKGEHEDDDHDHVQDPLCEHRFHSTCLVSAERVALRGADVVVDDDGCVEVSCPICRGIGCVSKEEWEEGVSALA